MKKMLFVASLVLLLSACGSPSVDDLVEDQELLAETVQECSKLMMEGKDTDTEKCKNAQLVQQKVEENMTERLMKQLSDD